MATALLSTSAAAMVHSAMPVSAAAIGYLRLFSGENP